MLYDAAGVALAILFAMSATVKVVSIEPFTMYLQLLGFGSRAPLVGRLTALVEAAISVLLLVAPGSPMALAAAGFVLLATTVTVASRLRAGTHTGRCFCFSTDELSTSRLLLRNAAIVLLALAASRASFSGLAFLPLLPAAALLAATRLALPALSLATPDTDNVI